MRNDKSFLIYLPVGMVSEVENILNVRRYKFRNRNEFIKMAIIEKMEREKEC
jgi:metal-responsive CopG/Arc/MetJ family transcriptional regulator